MVDKFIGAKARNRGVQIFKMADIGDVGNICRSRNGVLFQRREQAVGGQRRALGNIGENGAAVGNRLDLNVRAGRKVRKLVGIGKMLAGGRNIVENNRTACTRSVEKDRLPVLRIALFRDNQLKLGIVLVCIGIGDFNPEPFGVDDADGRRLQRLCGFQSFAAVPADDGIAVVFAGVVLSLFFMFLTYLFVNLRKIDNQRKVEVANVSDN